MECLLFPILFPYMGIHSSHTLATAWISASRKIFKKLFTFKCLFFLFSSSHPWVGKIWVFPSVFHKLGKKIRKFIQKPTAWNKHTIWLSTEYFHVRGIYTFPGIGDCKSFYQLHICKVEQNLGIICVFPYLFRKMRIDSSQLLGNVLKIVGINTSHEIYKKPIALECLCFLCVFLTMRIHFFHVFRNAYILVMSISTIFQNYIWNSSLS